MGICPFEQEINAKGAFLVSRELVKQNEAATFINTGTAASYFANPGQSSYTMSKLAVNMLLEQLNAGTLFPFLAFAITIPWLSLRVF